nr:tRNA uridine-5-carboxymethylaminomethyl(34) synthesis enzyme MnmG [Gemmatimonadaceae bacterium]
VRTLLEAHERLQTIQGTVARLVLEEGGRRVVGIETLEGRRFAARSVVITTGTFLRGRIHIGTETALAGGRAGESSTTHLAEQLERAGLEVARFKTGTPPRIDGRTVDASRLVAQPSELGESGYRWSHFWERGAGGPPQQQHSPGAAFDRHQIAAGIAPPSLPQLDCLITYLDAPGKSIIHENIARSAMYGGAISAQGPRYCPSVEDKIVRFPDAERHQLFLEPEGLDTTEMYVNGLSTSLPPAVQVEVLRSIEGLAQVQMTRAGYAIEYDYYPPTQLDATLQSRAVAGLYFAGQVNGTTGYEEAAGQGYIAGLNASRAARGDTPVILGRETSFIGVLVDDLVTRGVDEPYRLFTSRSEFRLTVRQDNAIARLSRVAREAGLYDAREDAIVSRRLAMEADALRLADETSVQPATVAELLANVSSPPLAHAVRIAELAKRQDVSLQSLLEAAGLGGRIDDEAIITAELELKYAGYFARERSQADKLRKMGAFPLPAGLPYGEMRSLSVEARQKLSRLQPQSLAQASRVPGINPTDLQNLVMEVEKRRRG